MHILGILQVVYLLECQKEVPDETEKLFLTYPFKS